MITPNARVRDSHRDSNDNRPGRAGRTTRWTRRPLDGQRMASPRCEHAWFSDPSGWPAGCAHEVAHRLRTVDNGGVRKETCRVRHRHRLVALLIVACLVGSAAVVAVLRVTQRRPRAGAAGRVAEQPVPADRPGRTCPSDPYPSAELTLTRHRRHLPRRRGRHAARSKPRRSTSRATAARGTRGEMRRDATPRAAARPRTPRAPARRTRGTPRQRRDRRAERARLTSAGRPGDGGAAGARARRRRGASAGSCSSAQPA